MTTTKTEESASVHLTRISKKEVSPQDARGVLMAAFTARDYIKCIDDLKSLQIDPQAYIDGLDQVWFRPPILVGTMLITVPHQVISELPPGSEMYYRSLRALRKTCGIYGILPASFCMPQELTLVTTGKMKRPFASGGFSDVWKARDKNGRIFAIKHLRTYETDDLTRMKKVLRVCYSTSRYFSWSPLPRCTAKRSPSAGE